MSRRKPPVRHPVRTHERSGKQVRAYRRGRGSKPMRVHKIVGKSVPKGSVLGDLEPHQLVVSKDQETAWWRPTEDVLVYWHNDRVWVDDDWEWVWRGPYVLKGYDEESMDGSSKGTFIDAKEVEKELGKIRRVD